MKNLILYLILCIPPLSYAQEIITLHKYRVSDVYPLITRETRDRPLWMYSVNGGSMQPIGLMGADLEQYLRTNAQSHQLLLDYRKKLRSTRTMGRIFTGLSTLGVIGILALDDRDTRDFTAGQWISLGAIGVGLAGAFAARPGYRKAEGLLEASVVRYNTERRN